MVYLHLVYTVVLLVVGFYVGYRWGTAAVSEVSKVKSYL